MYMSTSITNQMPRKMWLIAYKNTYLLHLFVTNGLIKSHQSG